MADANDRNGTPQAQHWQRHPESGLEVAPDSNDYPEVWTPPGHNDLYALRPNAEDQHKYLVSATDQNRFPPGHAVSDAGYSSAPDKTPDGHLTSTLPAADPALLRRSRGKKIIALAVVAVLIIIGAVVGGVVGSQAARSQATGGGASSR